MDTIDLDSITKSEAKKFATGSLNIDNAGIKEATEALQLLLMNCMKEVVNQALVLASEKAKLKWNKSHFPDIDKRAIAIQAKYGQSLGIDKQSILDVNKLIK